MDEWAGRGVITRVLERTGALGNDSAWRSWLSGGRRPRNLLELRREFVRLSARLPTEVAASVDDILDIYEALLGRRAGDERAGEAYRDILLSVLYSAELALILLRRHGPDLDPAELDFVLQALPIWQFSDVMLAHAPARVLFDALDQRSFKGVDATFLVSLATNLQRDGDVTRLARIPTLLLTCCPLVELRGLMPHVQGLIEACRAKPHDADDLETAAALCQAAALGQLSEELALRLWRSGRLAPLQAFQPLGLEYFRIVWACIHRLEGQVPPWFIAAYLGSTKPWRIALGEPGPSEPPDAAESMSVSIEGDKLSIRFTCPSAFVYCMRMRSMFGMLDRVADQLPKGERLVFRIVLGDECASDDTVCFSSNRASSILVPDPYYVDFDGYRREAVTFAHRGLPFSQRSPKAYWRGADTGVYRYPDPGQSPRVRVSMLSLAQPQRLDARIVSIERRVGWEANEARYRELGVLGDSDPIERILTFKYNLDIDGNSNAWNGCFLKLLSGSVLLKVLSEFGFRQWYYQHLEPWIHYVPVQPDLADLFEKIEFLEKHPALAEAIGQNGRRFAMAMSPDQELATAAHRVIARSLLQPGPAASGSETA